MPRTILIIVNDLNTICLLRRYAEESGLQTVRAGTDDLVTDLARSVSLALIIWDAEMLVTEPDVLHELMVDPDTREIPVMLYSHLNEPSHQAVEGFTDYITDSVLYGDFVAVLRCAGIRP